MAKIQGILSCVILMMVEIDLNIHQNEYHNSLFMGKQKFVSTATPYLDICVLSLSTSNDRLNLSFVKDIHVGAKNGKK